MGEMIVTQSITLHSTEMQTFSDAAAMMVVLAGKHGIYRDAWALAAPGLRITVLWNTKADVCPDYLVVGKPSSDRLTNHEP